MSLETPEVCWKWQRVIHHGVRGPSPETGAIGEGNSAAGCERNSVLILRLGLTCQSSCFSDQGN